MSEFTTGRWEAKPNRVIVEGRVLALINGGNSADVRLIAAAPEMYELLGMAMWSLRYHSENDYKIAYRIERLLARIDGEAENE